MQLVANIGWLTNGNTHLTMMDQDTVFVRGLAPGIHHEELSDLFSEIGPIKSAFVVVEKEGPRKGISRGFGFVQFALARSTETCFWRIEILF